MKERIRGRDLFEKYRGIINLLCRYYSLFSLKKRKKLLAKHRNTRGNRGYGLRYALLKSIAKECGDNVMIAEEVFLLNAQNLIIGSNVSIQPMCYLECGRSADNYIRIGNDVSIAHGTTIIATSHTYKSDETDIIRDMKTVSRPVTVGDNVWIGAKATVLFGTTVASGCVIGANSLVNKDTESNGIYVGSPARRVKDRK